MGQVDRVEPPFWWSGMKNPAVQVMLYGKEIAKYDPDVKGLDVADVHRTENLNYLFITLNIASVKAGIFEIRLKDGDDLVQTIPFELKERKSNSAHRKSYDSSDLIYLLMPDRFANGNPAIDSHPDVIENVNRKLDGGRHGGDIQGIIDHLNYIEELGVTAIWSTPLCVDNDEKYSYHTYAQSDVYKIDPRFGTNEDYKRLASELHKREMKLVFDYVTNHWGLTHWMMKDLPTYDWIHQFPGYGQTNYRTTTQMDPNTSQYDYRYCMDGWFVKSMPDLNQKNPLVLNYLTQNAIWWIEYANLDGFRVDTYSFNDKEAIAKWTKAITDEYPNFNIAGEVWMHDQAQMAYWQKDSQVGAIQGYNSNLPTVMDFTLHDAIMEVFRVEKPTWNTGIIQVYENFVNDFLYPNINNILVFAENHDTPRINELYPNFEDYQLAMTLIATVRGIPQIYYGSEIGMKGDKYRGDGDIRRDFPGGWQSDSSTAFTAEGRNETQNRYFNFSKKLFNWRKSANVIHQGQTTHYLPEDELYVYFRFMEGKAVMVILNNNKTSKELSLDRFTENLKGFQQGKDVLTDAVIKLGHKLTIRPKKSMILELEK
ncbi:MAG: glycosidase [Sediminicola sp.]|jgi:glycosidase